MLQLPANNTLIRAQRNCEACVPISRKATINASPAQSPPMEPPATAILSGLSAPAMTGHLAQLGFHQVRADRAGEERNAIDKHGRNARHVKVHGALNF